MIRYLATLGSAGLLAGLALLASPLIWPPNPDTSLVLRNGQFVGEVVGYVWAADPSTATIQVSSSLVGLHAFAVTVNTTTRITEGEKEGAFGDLTKHRRVRVVYEAREDGRLASSIDLLQPGELATPAVADVAATGELAPARGHWVEVAVFTEAGAAEQLVARLLEHNMTVALESVAGRGDQPRLRVRVGPFPDEAAAAAAKHNLRSMGYQASAIW